jgi:hypothetical protein
MKKNFLKLPLFLALGAMVTFGLSSCSDSDDNNGAETRLTANELAMGKATEQYVNNTVYTIYGKLAASTGTLFEDVQALRDKFVKDPSSVSQSDIDKVCEQFKDARKLYECSEAFLFGAATDFGIDPHIDTWPLDLDGLATALSNKSQLAKFSTDDDDANIAYAAGKMGQELLGFHGLEFVLFRNGANRTVESLKANESDEAFKNITVTGKEELYYAVAVAGDLRDRCWQMEVAWNDKAPQAHIDRVEELELSTVASNSSMSYGDNMLSATQLGSTYKTWQQTMVAICSAGCENIAKEVANTKIGNPYSGQDANYIESPYSQRSFIDFEDNLLSIQYSLYGGYELTAPHANSVMGYMQNHDSEQAAKLDNDLKAAIAAIKECQKLNGGFVNNISNPLVGTAQKAVQALDNDLVKAGEWFANQK